MNDSQKTSSKKIVVSNKKARFDYEIIETLEAGIVLKGEEIKSIRKGEITIAESYIRPSNDGLYLVGANITKYDHSGSRDYDPAKPRKLLLHKNEIEKLKSKVSQKGLTIVPLDIHLRNGMAKLEIALAKGKNNPDKRQSIKEREVKRDLQRSAKNRDFS
jgi:SsrA-binding protein